MFATETETISPEMFLTGLQKIAYKLTQNERAKMIDYGRAWATLFYNGRVPSRIESGFERLERRHVNI